VTPAQRRELVNAIRELPPQTRAALASDDFDLFCYYGWGVVSNSAQLESHQALRAWPPGSIHLWRWANRTGKTSGLILDHLWAIWKKWRYENEDLDRWLGYTYRTLQAAPLNRLMGKAWEAGEALIADTSILQRSPLTNRQRPAALASLFSARTGKTPDGSEAMWIECANGGRIDFLSTHDGAGRMESETWWLIAWDEFVRHQPVGDIPLLFDQTFLPRSSDFMAPVILSGTVTEDSDPIYAEMEDIASQSPKDWNIMSFDRRVNFSQSSASIDRQIRLSFDRQVADRSVEGKLGSGGRGSLLPTFLLANAFDDELEEDTSPERVDMLHAMGYEFVSMFDHAATGDLNVVQTWAVPWPPAQGDEMLGEIFGAGLAEKRSGSHMTPTLQAKFALDEVERFDSIALIVDGTGEGGALVCNGLQHDLAGSDTRVIKCEFSGRASKGTSNKEHGLQSLQRLLSWGLDAAVDEYGWVGDWPELPEGERFGILRFPYTGPWRKLHRELAVLKREDQHQRQDRAMTAVMGAWHLRRMLEGRQTVPTRFSMIPQRRRSKRTRELAVVR
jgi:hypothetical protein